MPTVTKKMIVAAIVEKTRAEPAEAKRALETVLESMKLALANGRQIDLGKLGKLKVVSRKPRRRVSGNLKYRVTLVEDVHKKHPKTVRLVGGKDLSANPLPTIVHKPEPVIVIRRRAAVALPAWRGRVQIKRRTQI